MAWSSKGSADEDVVSSGFGSLLICLLCCPVLVLEKKDLMDFWSPLVFLAAPLEASLRFRFLVLLLIPEVLPSKEEDPPATEVFVDCLGTIRGVPNEFLLPRCLLNCGSRHGNGWPSFGGVLASLEEEPVVMLAVSQTMPMRFSEGSLARILLC